jgi:hypothetical protein
MFEEQIFILLTAEDERILGKNFEVSMEVDILDMAVYIQLTEALFFAESN